jgi:hypothetical protein
MIISQDAIHVDAIGVTLAKSFELIYRATLPALVDGIYFEIWPISAWSGLGIVERSVIIIF